MSQKIKSIEKPKGLAKTALRIPIWLYHAHMGWLLGRHFMSLTHIGRKSGLLRQNLLEVIRYILGHVACIVASGWNIRSDWFRNILSNPKIFIQIGDKRSAAAAIRLTPESGAEELLEYFLKRPLKFRILAKFMGYQREGTEDDIRALGQKIPMFIFKPAPENERTFTGNTSVTLRTTQQTGPVYWLKTGIF
jgi:deazaflavin-dependent oxidoreductase (nitroreductase family)